jgi:hypothetical protein
VGQRISYTNLPYLPKAGAGCGAGDVNHPSILDGMSIGLGHEIQETVTAMLPIPGAMGDIKGTHSGTYAVQALWSDAAAAGAGWCSGVASTDLPSPLSGEPPY